MYWIMHLLGLDSGGGPAYLWWSGAGSDLGEAAIVGGLVSIYRRHNCHAKGCLRIGRYPVAGTPFITCRLHHPHINEPPTAEQIAAEHAENCEQH